MQILIKGLNMTNSKDNDKNNQNEQTKTTIILPNPIVKSKNPFAQPNAKGSKAPKGSAVIKPGNTWKKQ